MGESIGYLREGDFDDDDFEDDVLAAIMREIDLGVKVTVAALSCVGCYPVTSCNGCAGHPEDHAVVAFWCPPKAWPLVRQAAVRTGVSVTSVDLDIPLQATESLVLSLTKLDVASRSTLESSPDPPRSLLTRKHGARGCVNPGHGPTCP